MADDAENHPLGDKSLVSANSTNQSATDQPCSGDIKSPKRRRIEHSPTPSPVFSSYDGPLWNDSEQTNVHMKMVSLEKRFIELGHDEKKLNSIALHELAELITTVKQYKIVLDQIHSDELKTMKEEISKKDQEIENLKEQCKNLDGKVTLVVRGLKLMKDAIFMKVQEINSLKEQIADVNGNNAIEELKIAKAKMDMMEKKLAVLQNQEAEKTDETEPQAQKDSVSKQQQCTIGDEELSLNHKHKKLKILYKELMEKYALYKEMVEKYVVSENSELHGAIPTSFKDWGETQAKMKLLRDYESLKQENRKLIDEKKDLENHLSKMKQANSVMEKQNVEAVSQLDHANDVITEWKQANSVLEEQQVDAVSQLDHANDLIVQLKEAYSVLENKKMEATSQLNHTKFFVNSHLEALHVELNKSKATLSQQMKPQEGSYEVTSDSGEMKNKVKTELPEESETDVQLANSETMVDHPYEDGEIKIEIPETEVIPQENTNIHDTSVSAGKSTSTDDE